MADNVPSISITAPARTDDEFNKWFRAASGVNYEKPSNGHGVGRPDEHAADEEEEPPLVMPQTKHYRPKGSIANTPFMVSLISALLGALAAASFCVTLAPLAQYLGAGSWSWVRPQLGIYIGSIAVFHLMEFLTTSGWNVRKLSVDAFLLNNTTQYHIAHAFGITEYLLSSYFWPSKFESVVASPPVLALFVCGIGFGQFLRSAAMIHAADSFSHIVKHVKLENHTLVTSGVYAYTRHPSYVGFFTWAMATQLLMSNVASTLAFAFVLGRFFSNRIKEEEAHLVRFFGDKYLDYRKKVGTGLFWVKC